MFELEMDLEKNQYETGDNATPDAPEQQMQEAADELAELARRQEQLARNQNRAQNPTPEQRWQQEMLRREVEELQRRLEELSRGQQQAQSGQGGETGSSSSSSAAAESETSEQDRQRERNRASEMDELQRRLSSAMRAMNEANETMQQNGDPESLQRAMDEAQRQLEGARNSATEARQRAMQAAVDELAERADDVLDTQSGLERRLQEAVRDALDADNIDGPLDSGLDWTEELQLAEEKRDLLAAIQGLQRDALGTAQTFAEDQPDVAEELRDSIGKLQDMEIEARIAVAAAYIEQGEAVYVASSESAVTETLRQLREDLRRARGMIDTGADGEPGRGERMQAALAEARELRRALQRAAQGAGGNAGFEAGGPENRDASTGVRVADIEVGNELQRQAQAVSQEVTELLRAFSNAGASARDIDDMRQLAAGIRASDFSGNPDVLAREARQALSLVEQLELRLAGVVNSDKPGIRGNVNEEMPEQHREIIADYYRRLGQTKDD
jgi:DNA repair exonuclease SbcCD ATPase subunit